MTAKTCKTCRFLIKTGGYRGRSAERSCSKRKFVFVPAATWHPIADCKHYQPRQTKTKGGDNK